MNARDCQPSTLMACGIRRPGQRLPPLPSPQLALVLYHIVVACWKEHHRPDCRSVDVAEEVVVVVGIANPEKAGWARPGGSDVVDEYAVHGDLEEMS